MKNSQSFPSSPLLCVSLRLGGVDYDLPFDGHFSSSNIIRGAALPVPHPIPQRTFGRLTNPATRLLHFHPPNTSPTPKGYADWDLLEKVQVFRRPAQALKALRRRRFWRSLCIWRRERRIHGGISRNEQLCTTHSKTSRRPPRRKAVNPFGEVDVPLFHRLRRPAFEPELRRFRQPQNAHRQSWAQAQLRARDEPSSALKP